MQARHIAVHFAGRNDDESRWGQYAVVDTAAELPEAGAHHAGTGDENDHGTIVWRSARFNMADTDAQHAAARDADTAAEQANLQNPPERTPGQVTSIEADGSVVVLDTVNGTVLAQVVAATPAPTEVAVDSAAGTAALPDLPDLEG